MPPKNKPIAPAIKIAFVDNHPPMREELRDALRVIETLQLPLKAWQKLHVLQQLPAGHHRCLVLPTLSPQWTPAKRAAASRGGYSDQHYSRQELELLIRELSEQQVSLQQAQYQSFQQVQGELLLQRLLLQQVRQLLQQVGQLLHRIGRWFRRDWQPERLLLKDSHQEFQVRIADVLYVEAALDYVRIRLKEGRYEKKEGFYFKRNGQTLFKPSLGELEQRLKGKGLTRINPSYMIDVELVDYVDTRKWKHPMIWIGGEDQPLRPEYAATFYKRWQKTGMGKKGGEIVSSE